MVTLDQVGLLIRVERFMYTKIKIIVASQFNILVMPNGPNPETKEEVEQINIEVKRLSKETGKPVVLLFHT